MKILNKEMADFIVKHNETFKRKSELINGKRVFQYTYLLASYKDFNEPFHRVKTLEDKKEVENFIKKNGNITAHEMRGLTFVEDKEGIFTRTLFLHKFFNINQVEETQLEKLIDKEVLTVATKEDGSAITFVKVGNKTLAKTKFSFQSQQAVMANKIYNRDKNMKDFIDFCHSKNLTPLMEIVSPFNKIVLVYQKEELILLQIRNNETGDYLDIYSKEVQTILNDFNIKFAKKNKVDTLENILKDYETRENIEGSVISLRDRNTQEVIMVKAKTNWYFKLHKIITNLSNRYNLIIKSILDETIDDVLSQIPLEQKVERTLINDITELINSHINHYSNIILYKAKNFNGDRKEFVKENSNFIYFTVLMRNLNGESIENIENQIKKQIEKETYRLEQAEKFLKNLGFDKNKYILNME